VLSVQGDVLEHLRFLSRCGAIGVPVRRADELSRVAGLVIPGGESTTIGKLLDRFGLLSTLRERILAGMPVLGTCAGAILLGRIALLADGRVADQHLLGVLDTTARRNAFGRQVASFEGPVDVAGLDGGPMHGVFIRAPWFESVGRDVEVLGSVATPLGAKVVMVQQGNVLACAFHPELSGDDRLHRRLVELVRAQSPQNA
jgi:5'-phosphate synthase pdxT subunit